MKLRKLYIFAMALAAIFVQSCTKDQVADLREKEYGYVQFKLYKRASYSPATLSTRAADDILEYLSDATKLEVELYDSEGVRVRQGVRLSASDNESAEFGMRSEKLKLLAGDYTLKRITIYKMDEKNSDEIASYSKDIDPATSFSVTAGGLVMHDVLVDVKERGKVRFSLVKDFSDFTRGDKGREYTFDEICGIIYGQMKLEITPKNMAAMIATNVGSEKPVITRITPLFIKNIIMKLAFWAVGERKSSFSFSNLGVVKLPEELARMVGRLDFVIGVQSTAPYNTAAVTYGGKLYLNVIRNISEPVLEHELHSVFREIGLRATVESNTRGGK